MSRTIRVGRLAEQDFAKLIRSVGASATRTRKGWFTSDFECSCDANTLRVIHDSQTQPEGQMFGDGMGMLPVGKFVPISKKGWELMHKRKLSDAEYQLWNARHEFSWDPKNFSINFDEFEIRYNKKIRDEKMQRFKNKITGFLKRMIGRTMRYD